jgi:hypothetical protein
MEQIESAPTVQKKQAGFLAAYREILPAVVRHPATWLLLVLWLASTAYLMAIGVVKVLMLLVAILENNPVFLIIPRPSSQK